MKPSPWMLSVVTFVTTIALCSVYAARQLWYSPAKVPGLTTAADRAEAGTDAGPISPASSSRPQLQMVPVLLTDLQPGSRITAELIGEAMMLSSRIAAHRDTVLDQNALVGRLVRQKIAAATPLRLSMLYPVDRKPEIRIPPDLRLVGLTFTQQQALIGDYLQSGSYVDVLLTETGANSDVIVRKLFDGVRVFSVVEVSAAAGFEVLLELTPEQQLTVQLARQRGELTLTYNPAGPGSEGVALSQQNREIIRHADVFPKTSRPMDPQAPGPTLSTNARGFTAEHFRSGERTQTTFEWATTTNN